MLLNNGKEYSSNGTCIEVPTGSTSIPQIGQQPSPTLYNYLALLPMLITALTPLILEFRKKSSSQVKGKDNSD
jgi:hypothetical protein